MGTHQQEVHVDFQDAGLVLGRCKGLAVVLTDRRSGRGAAMPLPLPLLGATAVPARARRHVLPSERAGCRCLAVASALSLLRRSTGILRFASWREKSAVATLAARMSVLEASAAAPRAGTAQHSRLHPACAEVQGGKAGRGQWGLQTEF